jgi:hypothetical protein
MLAELDWQPLQKKKKKPQIDQFLQCHKPTYTSYNSWLRSDSNTFHQNSELMIKHLFSYKNSFIPHTIRVPPELVHVKTVDEFSSRLQLLTA